MASDKKKNYSTEGLNSRQEVQDALASAGYQPSEQVTEAEAALKAQQSAAPGDYQSRYQDQIDRTLNDLNARRAFHYNYAQDPLYQQYAQAYTQNAHNASADAAAQAAALTGGYGSSYAASVAQQAYQQQIGALNQAIPTLYQLALDTYDSGGDALVSQLTSSTRRSRTHRRSITRSCRTITVSSTGRAAPTMLPTSRTMVAIRTIWAGWTPCTATIPIRSNRPSPSASRRSIMC